MTSWATGAILAFRRGQPETNRKVWTDGGWVVMIAASIDSSDGLPALA